MTQKQIGRVVSVVLAVTAAACSAGDGTAGASSGVGEGSAFAKSASASTSQCPTEISADSTNCRWEVDRATREKTLVCVVGTLTFRVDSSGVGEGR